MIALLLRVLLWLGRGRLVLMATAIEVADQRSSDALARAAVAERTVLDQSRTIASWESGGEVAKLDHTISYQRREILQLRKRLAEAEQALAEAKRAPREFDVPEAPCPSI